MLQFRTHPLDEGQIAIAHVEDGRIVVVMNSCVTDSRVRCDAVNRLLSRLPSATAA